MKLMHVGGVVDRKINPRVLEEMARYDAWLADTEEAGIGREAKRIEHLLKVTKTRGLYEGPWERSMKYLVPEVSGGNGRPYRYPFHRMDVGESVFFDARGRDTSAVNAAHAHGSRYGKKFTAQREGDGYRIWRVS